MPLKINGATSGSVTLAAPATGTDVTLTLPGTSVDLAAIPQANVTNLTSDLAAKAADSTQGLYLVTAQAFSNAGSLSVNSCFTSTYDNYRIIINLSSVNYDGNFYMRLRKSGTDATTSYFTMQRGCDGAGNAQNIIGNNTFWWYLLSTDGGSSNRGYTSVIDICSPKVSSWTNATITTAALTSGGAPIGAAGALLNSLNDTYDGFTIGTDGPGGSLASGTVKVYGYKNA